MHTVISDRDKQKRMQQVRCQPPPSPSPCFYDSMRPAEAPGLLDFKRLTKANTLMVAGQEFLGQRSWEKHKRLMNQKENQGRNNHDLAHYWNDAKLKSVHVMPKPLSNQGMTIVLCIHQNKL